MIVPKKAFFLVAAVSFLLFDLFVKVMPVAAMDKPEKYALVAAARAALDSGEYEEAEQYMRLVIEEPQVIDAVEHAADMQNYALILYSQAKLEQAAKVYIRALPLCESAFGPDSLAVAENLVGLVKCLRRMGRYQEAEPYIQRTLDIRVKALGQTHRLAGNSWLDLAINYERQGKLAEARASYAKGLNAREAEFGRDSCDIIPYLTHYGNILRSLNESTAAAEVDARIKELSSCKGTPGDPSRASGRSGWINY